MTLRKTLELIDEIVSKYYLSEHFTDNERAVRIDMEHVEALKDIARRMEAIREAIRSD